MNCKDCKHWRRGGYFDHGPVWEEFVLFQDEKSTMGLCLHPSLHSDYGSSWQKREQQDEMVDGVIASSYDERADLRVGENFGCIHFEQKL